MPIYKDGSVWRIQNVKGSSHAKAAAEKRLKAIKASQAKRKKK